MSAVETIDLSAGFDGLSDAHKLLLAAAERDDVTFFNAANEVIDPSESVDHMEIRLHDDIDIDVATSVSIDAGSHVYLGAEANINIDNISGGDAIRIKVGGGLYDYFGDASADITGGGANGGIILESADAHGAGATIGGLLAAQSLDINLLGGSLTARAENNIYLAGENRADQPGHS
jgi:hypothetical protein